VQQPRGDTGAISRALAREVDKLELLIAKSWLAIGVLIGVSSVVVGVVLDADMGKAAFVVGALMFAWGAALTGAAQRGGARHPAWRWASSALESLSPFALIALMVLVIGPVRAFTEALFGPTLMIGAVAMISLLRMDWRVTLFGNAFGVTAYAAIVFILVPAVGTPDDLASLHFETRRSLVRIAVMITAGTAGAFISRGLRNAVSGTVRRVRERDLFGKYRLEREIAKGGMGTVWRATYCPEGGFSRPAAVKRIHAHLSADAAFVDAFRKEAELGARLVHHNIVQTLDFGSVQNDDDDAPTFFLAMELVDGCSCADLARRGKARDQPIAPPVVARIAHGVLAALAYAHEEARDGDGAPLRVVHRDVAPQNVLLSSAGLVKLTDFGIARSLRDDTAAVTEAMGHKGHVAPEHVDGKPIDARSDLFLVGILVWELLCGRKLFVREHEAASLRAILLEPAPLPSTIAPALAPWDAFTARALEKDPAARWQRAIDMQRALDDVIASSGVASADELGSLVRALGAGDVHDAETARLGAVGLPDLTAKTPARQQGAR
jgi:hypothetical protein